MNKRPRVVVSLPNDNAYQHEQGLVAKSAAAVLGLDLTLLQANDDSITQSQQLLEIIQARSDAPPAAFLVEPVTSTGLRKVAERYTPARMIRGIENVYDEVLGVIH